MSSPVMLSFVHFMPSSVLQPCIYRHAHLGKLHAAQHGVIPRSIPYRLSHMRIRMLHTSTIHAWHDISEERIRLQDHVVPLPKTLNLNPDLYPFMPDGGEDEDLMRSL